MSNKKAEFSASMKNKSGDDITIAAKFNRVELETEHFLHVYDTRTGNRTCRNSCISCRSSQCAVRVSAAAEKLNEESTMKIKDREEFEDAQAMARIAVERTNNSIPAESFWNAAMQVLISAYGISK